MSYEKDNLPRGELTGLHVTHIRKIETDEPKPIAIPDGWRELEPDEFPRVTDMYENEGAWRKRINDSSIEYARYEARHIRKIEPANTSETPNSSSWIPKVGDKVRVVGGFMNPVGEVGIVKAFCPVVKGNFTISTNGGTCTLGWFGKDDVQLIEAAS